MSDDLIDQLRRQAFGWCQQMCNEAADEIERLKAIVDAIPGDDKRLVAEWAVKIAAELMDEWEEGSTHDDTYYVVER